MNKKFNVRTETYKVVKRNYSFFGVVCGVDDVVVRLPGDVFQVDGVAGAEINDDDAVSGGDDVLAVERGGFLGPNLSGDTLVVVEETQFDAVGIDRACVGLAELDDGGRIELELEFAFLATPYMGVFDFLVGGIRAFETLDVAHVVAAGGEG